MEPVTIAIALGVALITSAAGVLYWAKILQWGMSSLLPWAQQNIPGLEPYIREAFINIDRVAAPTYALVKDAWQRVRKTLVEQLEVFEGQADGKWTVTVTSKVRDTLDRLRPAEEDLIIYTTTQRVAYEDLPSKVREHWLRESQAKYQINVTKERDAELRLRLSV